MTEPTCAACLHNVRVADTGPFGTRYCSATLRPYRAIPGPLYPVGYGPAPVWCPKRKKGSDD